MRVSSPVRAAALLALLVVGGSCQSRTSTAAANLVLAAAAPAEIGVLPLEDRSGVLGRHRAAASLLLRSALLDRGHTLLAPDFVAAAAVDPDAPALGRAGVLRVRILDWDESHLAQGRLRYRLHASLYLDGLLVSDHHQNTTLNLGPGSGDVDRLRSHCFERIWADLAAALPPPPAASLH